jgi:hypothetical protein
MNIKWTFNDGGKSIDCTSFPFAFRAMNNAWRKGIEGIDHMKQPCPKRTAAEMAKNFSITGPCGTKMERKYGYHAAKDKALENGLIDSDGNINGREFKQRRF